MTGFMDPEELGQFFDPIHSYGITDQGYEQAHASVRFTDESGTYVVGLEDVEFELEDE